MKKQKQLVAVLVATVLVVTAITGCGKTKEGQSTQEVQESSTQTSVEEKSSEEVQEIENFNAEGYPIVNEPITLDILLKINNTDSYMDFNEMPGFQMLEEMTGIKVEIEAVKQADWATKLSLIMASGEYPDVIWAGGVSQVDWEKYGVDEGILRPWDDLIEAYMPLYQERISMDPKDRLIPLIASDGHMYALADTSTGVTPQADSYYYINQKWLDALELDMPTDIESLTEVLRAFATKDPNGNGEADEIALTTSTGGLSSFAQLWGVPRYSKWIYIDDNGKIQLVPENERFKEYMAWMHML